MDQRDIIELIKKDQWMMSVLRAARLVNLPDWMIGGGFIRNKVWDYLHGFKNEQVPTADIDLIYFNPKNKNESQEKEYNRQLKKIVNVNWSTKNQARMNERKGFDVYLSSEDALSYWIEISTCVAVRLNQDDSLSLIAPFGIDDLVNLKVRPNSKYIDKRGPYGLEEYRKRVQGKKWKEKWPKLIIK